MNMAAPLPLDEGRPATKGPPLVLLDSEADALFEPAKDKVYRHPTFYAIPDEVKNL